MNFLVKNVIFGVVFASVFLVCYNKKNHYETFETYFTIFTDCSEFSLSQNNQLWDYSNRLKWLGCLTPLICNFIEVCLG